MAVRLHPHAVARAAERGAEDAEIVSAVETGERFPAKHGRTGFRRSFRGPWERRGRTFDAKQLIVYAVEDGEGWLVITVIVKFLRAAP